jgi:hypothetical protein
MRNYNSKENAVDSFVICPIHGIEYYDAGDCPMCYDEVYGPREDD